MVMESSDGFVFRRPGMGYLPCLKRPVKGIVAYNYGFAVQIQLLWGVPMVMEPSDGFVFRIPGMVYFPCLKSPAKGRVAYNYGFAVQIQLLWGVPMVMEPSDGFVFRRPGMVYSPCPLKPGTWATPRRFLNLQRNQTSKKTYNPFQILNLTYGDSIWKS